MLVVKRFSEWIKLKERLDATTNTSVAFKEGDIWWCAVGENIGVEVNGKNSPFSRPVFIYRKLSRSGFMAVPLSTVEKTGSWYINFTFKDKPITANIGQARVMSAARLYDKMGSLSDNDIDKIHIGFHKLYK